MNNLSLVKLTPKNLERIRTHAALSERSLDQAANRVIDKWMKATGDRLMATVIEERAAERLADRAKPKARPKRKTAWRTETYLNTYLEGMA